MTNCFKKFNYKKNYEKNIKKFLKYIEHYDRRDNAVCVKYSRRERAVSTP